MRELVVGPAGRLRPGVVPALLAVLAVVLAGSLLAGRYPLAPSELLAALASRLGGDPVSARIDSVVFGLRLPRALLAALVGTGLTVAGAAFQSLFSNPLATPDTLGVTAGASVGAVLALLLGLPLLGIQLISLAAGLVAVALTVAVSRVRGRSDIVMLILAGVVVAAIANAVLSMLKLGADPQDKLPQITYWLMGSMAGASMRALALGAPLIVVGTALIIAVRWRLNVLALGEDEARAAGVPVGRMRALVVLAATLVTASCISMCGQVGRVGLLVPHCARLLCGNSNALVVPVSAALGGIFVLVIDTLARTRCPPRRSRSRC